MYIRCHLRFFQQLPHQTVAYLNFSLLFSILHCRSPVSKEKHDPVLSAALLNGRKIQISLQLLDPDLTWRVASTAHWTLPLNQPAEVAEF